MKLKKRYIVAGVIAVSLTAFVTLVLMTKNKIIQPNNLIGPLYEIQGVDVSNYQGDIDWQKMEDTGIDFAYIKATEGSSHVDASFEENWAEAQDTDIYIGAYHFFSFESSGLTQADHYISTVGNLDGKLLPVIDVEWYANNMGSVDVESARVELAMMLDMLETEYERKPVIYTTYSAYGTIIKGYFDDYDLWIRNVYYTPVLDMNNVGWKYWQYSDRGKFDAYTGTEKYIDLNIFRGSKEEFLECNKIK